MITISIAHKLPTRPSVLSRLETAQLEAGPEAGLAYLVIDSGGALLLGADGETLNRLRVRLQQGGGGANGQ